jgi:hypothetical protein
VGWDDLGGRRIRRPVSDGAEAGAQRVGWGFFGALTFLIALIAILIVGDKKPAST